MPYRYKVVYRLKKQIERSVIVKALCNASTGFWVNANWEYTLASDAKVWIPPHAIIYIEKVK